MIILAHSGVCAFYRNNLNLPSRLHLNRNKCLFDLRVESNFKFWISTTKACWRRCTQSHVPGREFCLVQWTFTELPPGRLVTDSSQTGPEATGVFWGLQGWWFHGGRWRGMQRGWSKKSERSKFENRGLLKVGVDNMVWMGVNFAGKVWKVIRHL